MASAEWRAVACATELVRAGRVREIPLNAPSVEARVPHRAEQSVAFAVRADTRDQQRVEAKPPEVIGNVEGGPAQDLPVRKLVDEKLTEESNQDRLSIRSLKHARPLG